MYVLVKYIHVVSVTLSLAGFVVRGLLLARGSPLMTSRWIRVLPHINDTVLLSAAVGLVLMSGQYPFVDAWLTAKVLGLTAYIILGSLALRAGSAPGIRISAWLAALVVFGWIVSVALTRQPQGFLAAAG
jgi:uncharacterized membrane protein SirB2